MKTLIITILLFIATNILADYPIYYMDDDDYIVGVDSPSFTGIVKFSTTTTTNVPASGIGWLYMKSGDSNIYFQNELGIEYDLTEGAAVTGNIIVVQEDGVNISSDALTIDFDTYFAVTESPDQKANITIDTSTLLVSYITSTTIAGLYLLQTDAASTYLTQSSATVTYLSQSSAVITYLGINAKADDSDLLDGYNYDWFLSTTIGASVYLTQSSAAATYWQTSGWESYFDYTGGRVAIASDVYTTGYTSSAYFYGDGSNLTNLPGGVGGNDTEVQFNNSGTIDGDSGFIWNGSTAVIAAIESTGDTYSKGDFYLDSGNELILDTDEDSDTSIRESTTDTLMFKVAGADKLSLAGGYLTLETVGLQVKGDGRLSVYGGSSDVAYYWNVSGYDSFLWYFNTVPGVSNANCWVISYKDYAVGMSEWFDDPTLILQSNNSSYIGMHCDNDDNNEGRIFIKNVEKINIDSHTWTYSLAVSTKSTADLQSLTPTKMGEIYMHETSPGICVSTGAATGEWGYIPVQALP